MYTIKHLEWEEGIAHGRNVTPGKQGFQLITNSNYVDKTVLIDLLNVKVGTTERLVCVSRPHRFGKSFAAQMLCTYYDCSCDSHALFEATINGDDAAVAEQIELIHREETSPLHYNKEDSLRSVIKLAYYTYRDRYVQWEELPSGEGLQM